MHESLVFISLVLAAFALTIASAFMLILLSRNSKSTLNSRIYSGALSTENEMIGKGQIFDFNNQNHTKRPMHTTHTDMMWKLGRFTHNSSIDTYFYMAIFTPSYKNYARILRRKITEKAKETD